MLFAAIVTRSTQFHEKMLRYGQEAENRKTPSLCRDGDEPVIGATQLKPIGRVRAQWHSAVARLRQRRYDSTGGRCHAVSRLCAMPRHNPTTSGVARGATTTYHSARLHCSAWEYDDLGENIAGVTAPSGYTGGQLVDMVNSAPRASPLHRDNMLGSRYGRPAPAGRSEATGTTSSWSSSTSVRRSRRGPLRTPRRRGPSRCPRPRRCSR